MTTVFRISIHKAKNDLQPIVTFKLFLKNLLLDFYISQLSENIVIS